MSRVKRYLGRDPLRHLVALKMLHALGTQVETRFVAGRFGEAALILLNPQAFAYDRKHYKDCEQIAVISSDHPTLTRQLLEVIRRDQRIVFKLSSEADALEVQALFSVQPINVFLSFTNHKGYVHAHDSSASLTVAPSPQLWAWFAAQDHEYDWLAPMLRTQQAFCVTLEGESACFAFENFTGIWEIGGVYTTPAARGRGLARRVVETAVAELGRRGFKTRYQVQRDNYASIRVAQAVGLELFLTTTHFQTQ